MNEKHFYIRLMERFAVCKGDFDRESIERDILSYENYPLTVEYTGRSFHRIEVNGSTLIVVYDWEGKSFVTALPSDYLIQDNYGKWIKNKRFKKKKIRKINQIDNFNKKIDAALGRY